MTSIVDSQAGALYRLESRGVSPDSRLHRDPYGPLPLAHSLNELQRMRVKDPSLDASG